MTYIYHPQLARELLWQDKRKRRHQHQQLHRQPQLHKFPQLHKPSRYTYAFQSSIGYCYVSRRRSRSDARSAYSACDVQYTCVVVNFVARSDVDYNCSAIAITFVIYTLSSGCQRWLDTCSCSTRCTNKWRWHRLHLNCWTRSHKVTGRLGLWAIEAWWEDMVQEMASPERLNATGVRKIQ